MTPNSLNTLIAAAALVPAAGLLNAHAQIGSGWTQYSPSRQYHSGMAQSQRYSISGNVEHFWTYNTDPHFSGNVFHGINPNALAGIGEAARAMLARDNWFVGSQDSRSTPPGAPRGRRGR